jgi:hypothetical protein
MKPEGSQEHANGSHSWARWIQSTHTLYSSKISFNNILPSNGTNNKWTRQLIPLSRVHLEKQIIVQVIKKFPSLTEAEGEALCNIS